MINQPNWKSLLQKRETPTHFIVEGHLPVSRLKDSSYLIEKELKIGTDLSREEASNLLGFHFHRGHLAIARKPSNPPLQDLQKQKGTLVILPEIADPGNLGTIIRNTAALGGSGILLGKGASPYNAKAIRASAGNLFRLPVRQSPDLLADLLQLKQTHTLIGTSLSPNSVPLQNLPATPEKPALLLGPEDFGLTPEIEALCHHLVHLPMARSVDSLNVASASAIFLHQLQQSFS
ncbi:MAG: tRNA G18 (ribose-2'-O)-methylase SpoU [Akkermansiaceae bacterium]|jgi:tRNA G18 (ribose-2'-O)-methylase SpoU